ncbi:MAG: PilZ domain-containing protein [Methylococcales bacterium]
MKYRKRVYLSQYLNIIDQDSNEQIGYLADLSKNGMMFITHIQIHPNSTINIYVVLDYQTEGVSSSFVKAQIQTCWIRPNINHDMFCTGCKILHIDLKSEKILEETAHSLGFDSDLEISRVSRL